MDKEQAAIERLKLGSQMSLALYKQPLLVTYSGGKDSDVMLYLAKKSGIPFEVNHSLTTADAPQTIHHVKEVLADLEAAGTPVSVDKHIHADGTRDTMWNLIPRKLIPPTRVARYCCEVLKEGGGRNRMIATGVRWDESNKRRASRGILEVNHYKRDKRLILSNDNDEDRRLFEDCQMKGKRVVNPIVDWTTGDIWEYVSSEHIQLNPLYECGFHRVGCIGCPLASRRIREAEFQMFPRFRNAYVAAFDRMLKERHRRGKLEGEMRWGSTPVDIYHWWMGDDTPPGQTELPEIEPITFIPETTWQETHTAKMKKVRCIETGITYESGAAAARAAGVTRSAVVDAIRKNGGVCNGLHYEFVTDDTATPD